jgi:hypothetical protein
MRRLKVFNQATGDGSELSLSSYLGDSRAASLIDSTGKVLDAVVPGSDYFNNVGGFGSNNATSQAITLIHEALHANTNAGDVDLATKPGLWQKGMTANEASGLISARSADCFK